MGETVTQTVSFEKWTINTPDDALDCLQDLAGRGYRGHVRTFPKGDEPFWDLEINGDPKTSVQVLMGMVVVLLGGVLEALTTEQLEARFS